MWDELESLKKAQLLFYFAESLMNKTKQLRAPLASDKAGIRQIMGYNILNCYVMHASPIDII